MRITGGNFKGKEITSKKQRDSHIRPTAGRVREAIFNLLKHGKFLSEVDFIDENNPTLLYDRTIADIYSGTGILGFEALSRGAKAVIFADNNDESIRISQRNAANLQIEDKCIFSHCNATNLPTPPAIADVIFMDPPYEKGLLAPCLSSIAKAGWLRDGGVIVAEHSKKEDIFDDKDFKILDSRPYNNTVVTILKKIS